MRCEAKTIVELGVRGGESTRAFLSAARNLDATVVSVDIEPAQNNFEYADWHFVSEDDIRFGNQFEAWCENRNIESEIDVLYIDTSHLYDHTIKEIETWFPHLAPDTRVIFHDTNLTRYYLRDDGSIGIGWDNDRGVIRAIEEFLDTTFDETKWFVTYVNEWEIEHYPRCNGLTVLTRRPQWADADIQ